MGCRECDHLENQLAMALRHEQEVGRAVVADRAVVRPILQDREAIENLAFAMTEARETTEHWRTMLEEHRKTHSAAE